MIVAFSLFVLCQLVGEVIVRLANIAVPGPVVGIILLVCWLSWRGQVPADVQRTSSGLLTHLSLLFIPAGTGVMVHMHKLRMEWLPILGSLLIGTLLTLIVTVLVFIAVTRLTGAGPADTVASGRAD
jgi:holin-like protein